MTKATKVIFSGVMLIAVLIAGWAFLKDERERSLNLAPVAEPEAIEVRSDEEIKAQIESIDAQLQLLSDDLINITVPTGQPDANAPVESEITK